MVRYRYTTAARTAQRPGPRGPSLSHHLAFHNYVLITKELQPAIVASCAALPADELTTIDNCSCPSCAPATANSDLSNIGSHDRHSTISWEEAVQKCTDPAFKSRFMESNQLRKNMIPRNFTPQDAGHRVAVGSRVECSFLILSEAPGLPTPQVLQLPAATQALQLPQ